MLSDHAHPDSALAIGPVFLWNCPDAQEPRALLLSLKLERH